ncbi:MAG: RNA-binding protein [Puia sp.]|nr:RNA-binding protein [Puia sp.]
MSNSSNMDIRIFNISQDTTDREISKLFSSFGVVDSAGVNRNSLNGRSLKNGHVSMPVEAQARQAILSLDKTILDGKVISVSEKPSEFY